MALTIDLRPRRPISGLLTPHGTERLVPGLPRDEQRWMAPVRSRVEWIRGRSVGLQIALDTGRLDRGVSVEVDEGDVDLFVPPAGIKVGQVLPWELSIVEVAPLRVADRRMVRVAPGREATIDAFAAVRNVPDGSKALTMGANGPGPEVVVSLDTWRTGLASPESLADELATWQLSLRIEGFATADAGLAERFDEWLSQVDEVEFSSAIVASSVIPARHRDRARILDGERLAQLVLEAE